MGILGTERVRLYQSEWFARAFPIDNDVFERYIVVPKRDTRDDSLRVMREAMLGSTPFEAGIFIGGMKGVEEEFSLFRQMHPHAAVLPIASTGAAARVLFEREAGSLHLPASLATDYAYPTLFRSLLNLPTDAKEG
jgi:hypothetical protein